MLDAVPVEHDRTRAGDVRRAEHRGRSPEHAPPRQQLIVAPQERTDPVAALSAAAAQQAAGQRLDQIDRLAERGRAHLDRVHDRRRREREQIRHDRSTQAGARGPKGRGFLPVLATVGIPKTAPNPTDAKSLIEFLDNISQQARTITEHGFFPVVAGKLSKKLNPGSLELAAAVKKQQSQKDALPSVLPIGLGGQSGAYAKVFTDSFTRMVLNKEDPMSVLKDEGSQLQTLLTAAGAACWQPDPKSSGVCQVGA